MSEKEMITYKIVEHIGVVEDTGRGWHTELNRISWNGNPPKLDLRSWNEDRSRMGKGLTLTEEAGQKLRELLNML